MNVTSKTVFGKKVKEYPFSSSTLQQLENDAERTTAATVAREEVLKDL